MRSDVHCGRAENDAVSGPCAKRLLDTRAGPSERRKQVGCFGRSIANLFTFNGRALVLLVASSDGASGARTADPVS